MHRGHIRGWRQSERRPVNSTKSTLVGTLAVLGMFRIRAGLSTVRRLAMSRARRAVTWLLVSVEDDGLNLELFPAGHLGHAQLTWTCASVIDGAGGRRWRKMQPTRHMGGGKAGRLNLE